MPPEHYEKSGGGVDTLTDWEIPSDKGEGEGEGKDSSILNLKIDDKSLDGSGFTKFVMSSNCKNKEGIYMSVYLS